MFFIREIYFSEMSFIINGLFWSLTALAFACWRMHVRGITWKEIGLCAPESFPKAVAATAFILILSISLIVVFQIIKDNLGVAIEKDNSEQTAAIKFAELEGNWGWFFTIIPAIWP